jgi:single-strand DNA-binding protein
MALNHITLMGRIVRDVELRRTGSGVAVASFTIAVDRDFSGKDSEKKTDFIDCVAWRQTGEFISKHFTKGRMIVVDGRLEMRDWTDKDGNKRRSAEVIVENAYFGDSKRDGDSGASYGGNAYGGNSYSAPAAPSFGGYSSPAAPASDFAMLDDDDAQLPF